MFYKPRHILYSLAATAVLAIAAAPSIVCASETQDRSQAEILWDEFGIPHIYGPTILSVVRGLGYAEMENHAETLLMNVAAARGRSAEYFGPGDKRGDNYANIANDIQVRTEDIPNRAQSWLRTGGDEQAAIIQAFIDGANDYSARHGDTIDPKFRRVLPLVSADVPASIQNAIHFTFMPEQDNLPALISAWRAGGIAAANAAARKFTPTGSNGWAIAPRKSASGNAILMGNPHLPWGNNAPLPLSEGLGLFQWMEVNLVVGDPKHPRLNASGVVFVGAPFIGIGYSDEIGWTHTNNTIQNTNLYEITLNNTGTYNFDGQPTPLQVRTDAIKILQPDGSLVSQSINIFSSVHGPIIAQNNNKALALRVAGLAEPSIVSQYWRMIKAHNLTEFIDANSALQMPFFNVIYADRHGHIMYLFGGQQPVRDGGDWSTYSGILDGGKRSLLWTQTLSWLQLPRAIDPPGGFVANSNNPPWTSTLPQTATNDPSRFPKYLAPQFMDMRAQHGARYLQAASGGGLTPTSVLAGKESTGLLLADRVLPDLIAAAAASADPVAQRAAATLAAWDHTADAASKGAVLFEQWWANVVAAVSSGALPADHTIDFYSPHPEFRVGWSSASPLDTPRGLANPAALVPYLVAAANAVADLGVAWGDVHRIVLADHDKTFQTILPLPSNTKSGTLGLPQSGADDPFGPLRVLNPFPAPDGSGHMWAYGGDGYVQIVEFTPAGARASALLDYGNASRPGSTHITDQLPFFEAKMLRSTYRSREDAEKHAVSREIVAAPPTK
jgi:acyl-homoserine-lactone acylase